ncbi:MAG: 30S ribosomal protein S11, partial [archaeon]
MTLKDIKEDVKEKKELQTIAPEIAAEDKKEEAAVVAESEEKETKPSKPERNAIAYIFSSQNNTMVHITDMAGNTLSRVTGGMVTKHSRLKSSPTIAMFVAKKAAERARDLGITGLFVRTRAKTGSIGIGPGSHAAVKTLGYRVQKKVAGVGFDWPSDE